MKSILLFPLLLITAISIPAANAGEKLLVIGGWDYGEAVFDRAATQAGMSAKFITTEDTGLVTVDQLAAADVVFLLNLHPQGAPVLLERLTEARKRQPKLIVLPLDNRETQKGIEQAGLLKRDEEIRKYWRFNGYENTKRLLGYVRVKHLGGAGEIQPPIPVPDHGIYAPGAPDTFPEIPAFTTWAKSNGQFREGGSRVALLVQQSFLLTGDTKVYDAMVNALGKRGVNVAVIFASDPKKQKALLDAWDPELMIDDAHASPALKQGAEERDIPMLKSVALLRSTVAEWQASAQGMLPADVGLHFLTQEVHGIIDPVLVGGMKANVGGYKLHEPIPDRVERLADRAASWLNLRHKKNAEKRIAIVFYNKYLGKSDVGRGSATGAFLDGPASLFRVLVSLKERGYSFSKFPKDADELLSWMKRDGRNIGNWAGGDLSELLRDGKPELIPTATYERWFARLGDDNRRMVTTAYGPAPGMQMVTGENAKSIVIPRVNLGNVILLPQPARGPENDEKLLHARDVPPPHQYLACYWWLQEGFKADAVIHFGTHGTELLLPGKSNGMSADNFGDICLGNMPNIYPWIIDNIAEAIIAKRRAYAVTIDHLTPTLESAGLSDELKTLHDDIEKFATLDEGLLKQKYRKTISEAASKAALTKLGGELTDPQVEEIAGQLHRIELSVTAVKLHTLGLEPETKHLVPFITSMLGRAFLDDLAKALPVPADIAKEPEHVPLWTRPRLESIVKSMIVDGLSPADALTLAGGKLPKGDPGKIIETLSRATEYRKQIGMADREIGNILRALDGKFISPGSGADPVRNPSAVPTGRNLYALNPEEIPTKQAWAVGVELVDQLLKQKPGLKKVALDMNGHETMRDFGVTEAQALYLMGVKPVWNHNNLAVGVEIIPRAELKRPRVDVFLSIGGSMRDRFPTRVKLLDRAIRLVSELDEPDNLIRAGTQEKARELAAQGFSPEKVQLYAPARMFGGKPGEYGTRILYLVPRTGAWEDRKEIADIYKQQMSHVFTGDAWGEHVPGLYEQSMRGTELILRTWTSNMTGPLTNHHVYEYAGGLSIAIESTTGKQPKLIFNDVRGKPQVRDFDEVLASEAHVTMFNPKWLRGMMENGYSGGGMMAEVVRNTSGWEATRKGAVSQEMWAEIHAVYVRDKHDLKLREWLDAQNPHARQEILATLLEAARKGDWKADEVTRREMARDYAASVAKFGDSAGLATGGNTKLQTEVAKLLNAPGDAGLAGEYKAALDKSQKPAPVTEVAEAPKSEIVQGEEMTAKPRSAEAEPTGNPSTGFWTMCGIGGALLLLVGIGASRRKGVI
ncbi:cobaltochelatase subunit CobN [Zavarzinella formosa]|uniref:cobaltochelatase subunit CobN n=1 Tax=Zavarzinella formosa TaxID=360055 RepID=UPI0002FFA08B|nr:cobaltochelatase subunit CobN [Zavarzinella formosa]